MLIMISSYKFPILKYLLLSIMLFYELSQQINTKCWATEKKILKAKLLGVPY